jgi:hypothetical protein
MLPSKVDWKAYPLQLRWESLFTFRQCTCPDGQKKKKIENSSVRAGIFSHFATFFFDLSSSPYLCCCIPPAGSVFAALIFVLIKKDKTFCAWHCCTTPVAEQTRKGIWVILFFHWDNVSTQPQPSFSYNRNNNNKKALHRTA